MQIFKKPGFYSTVTYAGLVANILTLCEPGELHDTYQAPSNATQECLIVSSTNSQFTPSLTLSSKGIGNLGAGGFGSVKAIAVANALVYGLMTVGILLSAPVISYIGLKPVLILGCAFFCVCGWLLMCRIRSNSTQMAPRCTTTPSPTTTDFL